jgi:putative peptidoglycan lipid II flippase
MVAVVALAANIALSLLLMGPLRHAGLALATALSAILNIAVLLVFLARRLGAFGWEAILRSHARVLLASVPIVVTCLWIAGLGVWAQPEAWAAKTVMLIVGMGISVAGYVTVHALLGSDELGFLWGLVRRKITQTAA